MHIPDGYLGPQTYLPAYAAMIPIWAVASARVRQTLRLRQAPLLALGAAFCFVIMMFNIPIVGRETGHAVGGVLVAILLGPWAAVLAVSLALVAQAFLFGDGGITAIGANCFTMGVVMPFAGWWTYRWLAGGAPSGARRHVWAAAAGGYVGLNAAALATAVLFGIQPLLARDAAGLPLYCPFGLGVSVPAMAIGHLLVFGVVEALATGFVVAYLQRAMPGLLPASPAAPPARWAPRLAAALLGLVLLAPLGLLLPHWFPAGAAWGEWSPQEVATQIGRVPAGLARLSDLWKAPMPDYALPGQEAAPLHQQSLHYIFAGLLGTLLLLALGLLLRRMARKEPDGHHPGVDAPPGG